METEAKPEVPKKSIPEPPGRPKKEGEKEEEEEGERREGAREGGNEKTTVFVSNLKMSVTKEEVEEKFSQVSVVIGCQYVSMGQVYIEV